MPRPGIWAQLLSRTKQLRACVDGADLVAARELFESMPLRDVVAWTSYLGRDSDPERAASIFHRMPCWDSVSLNALLSVYARAGLIDQAQQLLDQTADFLADLDTDNVVLNGLASAGYVDRARLVFEDMPTRDVVSWTTLLQVLPVDEARAAFEAMPGWDLVATNAMVTAYAQSGYMPECRRLFDEARRRDDRSWNALLSGYGQAGDIHRALQVVGRMPEQSTIAWSTMVGAYSDAGDAARAKTTFDAMPERGVAAWTALLAGCANAGLVSEAEQVMHKMPAHGMNQYTVLLSLVSAEPTRAVLFWSPPSRDLVLWTSLLAGYAKRGEAEKAKTVFDLMPQWDIIAWSAMLAAYSYSSGRDERRPRDLMSWMLLEGVKATANCFLCLLLGCSHNGSLQIARSVFLSMSSDHGIEASRDHYCCMVHLLARAGRLVQAEDLVRTMPYLPDAAVWHSLLDACASHRDARRAEEAASGAVGLDQNDGTPFVLLAKAYKRCRS